MIESRTPRMPKKIPLGDVPLIEDKPRKVFINTLDKWARDGVKCHYVRFHQPVPPAKDMEPVSEFSTKAGVKDKYFVDSLTYTPHGIVFRCKGELDITPLANVIVSRSIL